MRHLSVAVALTLAATVSAQDPQRAADAWADAFLSRDMSAFRDLLWSDYTHQSVCGTLDREEELGATAAAFGASNSFLVESASVTVMGTVEVKGRQVADAKFDYEVRFVSHNESVVVQASDVLMFISEDDGETWAVRDWVEAYPVRLQSVDDCASYFVGTRNNWLLAQATAVEELSLGVLKTRYRR